jgi:hypothetical protein
VSVKLPPDIYINKASSNSRLTAVGRHSILIKGKIDQKEITIINLYTPNVNAPNFIKHTLKNLKAYINSNTVVVEDFNNHYHQQIGHPNKKSIKKS